MPQPVLWSFLEKKKLIFVSDSCALNVQKSGMLTYLFDLNKITPIYICLVTREYLSGRNMNNTCHKFFKKLCWVCNHRGQLLFQKSVHVSEAVWDGWENIRQQYVLFA